MHELLAAVMGLVEGLTEFLPVSSTGHLILAGRWLGFEQALGREVAATFEIFIQLGAILAVVVAYPGRFAGLLDVRRREGFAGWRGIGLLACTSAPAFLIGALAHDWIKEHLFAPWSVAVGLAVGALWILATEWRRPAVRTQGLDVIQWPQALSVGLFQCLALWPGLSRSAATILGAMLLGIDRKTATEYSFFAAVPVLCAAAIADLVKSIDQLSSAHLQLLGIGLVVSFVSALAAVKWLLHYVAGHSLSVFAWYRLVLAAVVLIFTLRG
jgi:undecaprenyl-diphosphatase